MNQAPSPFRENGVQFAFDATSLEWHDTCPRLYQYSMIERWRQRNKSVHLWFGGIFASALERYYKLTATGMSWMEALEEIVRLAMIESWEYKRDEAGEIMLDAQGRRIGAPYTSFDPNKTREALIRSIVWYVDQFKDEEIKVLMLSDGTPAVEHSFKLAIDHDNILCGHIDRVVLMDDVPYLMDQKTTGSTITQKFFNDFDLNMQMSAYTFAGKAIFDIPIRGVIIDGAQIAVGFTRFQRGFTFRSPDQLDEWYEDLLRIIEEIQTNNTRNYYPKRTSSCGKYGGCAFKHVCSKSPAVRKNFLAADFQQEAQWNPLQAR